MPTVNPQCLAGVASCSSWLMTFSSHLPADTQQVLVLSRESLTHSLHSDACSSNGLHPWSSSERGVHQATWSYLQQPCCNCTADHRSWWHDISITLHPASFHLHAKQCRGPHLLSFYLCSWLGTAGKRPLSSAASPHQRQ